MNLLQLLLLFFAVAVSSATFSVSPHHGTSSGFTFATQEEHGYENPNSISIQDERVEYFFSPSSSATSSHTERKLPPVTALNSILANVQLRLPDTTVSQGGIDITITQLTCSEVSVENINIGHSIKSKTKQRIDIALEGLRIVCNFRWEYKWTIFDGRGDGRAEIGNGSNAAVALEFFSPNYNVLPPEYVTIPFCKRDGIQVADLFFDGDGLGFIGGIINLFESLLRGTVSAEVGASVCEELGGLGDDAMDDLLRDLSDEISVYLPPSPSPNSLSLESTADTSKFVNFQELDQYSNGLLKFGFDQLESILGDDGSGSEELGINDFLRDNLLDGNGVLAVDPSVVSPSGVIFEGHDMLTQTTMRIKSIKVKGLDTFSFLDLLNPIGKHTLQNVMKLDDLSFTITIEAIMKASSLSSAVIVAPNSKPITETFTIDFAMKDIEIDFSLFLALNVESLDNLELGSLLNRNDILPCVLSAIDEATFTGLSVSVSDMVPPTLSGFLDVGIDKIISTGAVALFHMYEKVFIRAMPSFFDMVIREKVNDFMQNSLVVIGQCPEYLKPIDGFVDFRDLLMMPSGSLLAGGSGGSPYGDLIPWVMDVVEKQLMSSDDEGFLHLNDKIIRPLTKRQSGIEGEFHMNGILFRLNRQIKDSFWTAVAESLTLRLSNLRVSGIDTFQQPIKFLDATSSSGYMLENVLNFGVSESNDFAAAVKPMVASVRLEIIVDGINSPFAMNNDMDFQIIIPPIEVFADLFATIRESRFVEFPLRDILNFDCWLSTIPSSRSISTEVSKLKPSINTGVAFDQFGAVLKGGIRAQTSCIYCSNNMLEDFMSIINFLDDHGFMTGITSKALDIGSDLVEGTWVSEKIDRRIEDASLRCPHDPSFGISSNSSTDEPSFQASRSMVDGIIYAGMSLFQATAVIMAKNRAVSEIVPETEIVLDVPETANVVDLTNLEEIASWADMALDTLREYVGGIEVSEEGEEILGITRLLQSSVLDENGLLTIQFEDNGFEDGGVKMSLYNVTLIGLDSFSVFEVLNPLNSETIGNRIHLEKLGVTLEMGLSVEESSNGKIRSLSSERRRISNDLETITTSLILKDVELDLSFMMALDQELLGNLKLGSILKTDQIFYCLLSAIHDAGLPKFALSVGDISEFSVAGFVSDDTQMSIANFRTKIFMGYKQVILDAIPTFSANTLRPILHNLMGILIEKGKSGGCPEPLISFADEFIDFRDLLMLPESSVSLGGSGLGSYGDLIPMAMNLIRQQLFSADDKGFLSLNEKVIRPLTKAQSGTEGSLRINGTVLDLKKEPVTREVWTAFADSLRLRLSNLHVSGLDSFYQPIKVLSPTNYSGYVLENQLNVGAADDLQKPLQASVNFELVVGGENSPLAMNNVMDLQISLPPIELIAELFTTIRESRMMEFPIEDIFSFDCWLSTIPHSSSEIDIGLALNRFSLFVNKGITAQTSCIHCSNSMLEDFASVVHFLEENGFVSEMVSRVSSIGSDLLEGSWLKDTIIHRIKAASRRCPHDPNFVGIAAEPEANYPPFQASRSMVDGIIYGGMHVVQVIAIVWAQKHVSTEVSLDHEIVLDVPETASVIDLSNLSSVASWADMALNEVRQYVSEKVVLENGEEILGIANLLQESVLENGLLTIPFEDKGFDAGGVKLSLYNVTLIGLDSFTQFDILNSSDAHTLGNKIRLETLGVTLEMGLSVEEQSERRRQIFEGNGLETVKASLIFKDVELDVSFLMALDQDLLADMKLGSLLNTNQIFYCLLSTIHDVGLSNFIMNIGDISEFSLSGFVSDDTQKNIDSFTSNVFTEYKGLVVEAFPAFTSNTVRPILHSVLKILMEKGKNGGCPQPIDSASDALVDFRDLLLPAARAAELLGNGDARYGDLFQLLYGFIEEITSATDKEGMSKINELLISKFTSRQSEVEGELHFPGLIAQQNFTVSLNGLEAFIEINVSDIRVSHLDSVGAPVQLLEPVKGETSMLNNSATIGAGTDALRVSFELSIQGDGKEVSVNNKLELGLSLRSLGMILEVLAEIKEHLFLNFPLRDILNVHCWLATIVTPELNKYGIREGDADSALVLQKLALAVAEASLEVNCISCSSQILMEMSSYLSSSQGVVDTTSVMNMIFEYGTNLLKGDFVQSKIDQALRESASRCPHSESYDLNFQGFNYQNFMASEASDSYGFLIATISVILIVILVSIGVFLATSWVSRRRHKKWLETLSRHQLLQLEREQANEKLQEKNLNARMKSLIRSEEIPLFIRLFIPVVILGNIALFLSGHLSLGGTVNISGSFAGQDFDVEGFFEFSMAKSTVQMWEAGAKVLAILIVIFSGVWPYTKQLITFFIWFASPRIMASKRRGRMLQILDSLGKWSMVDVFVLIMTLASFRISVTSPDHLSFLPESLYSINLLVIPKWGLYSNLLAQIISQLSSHVIIHYHRKVVKAASSSNDHDTVISSSENKPQMLRKHRFQLDYEASSKQAVLRSCVDWILAMAMLSLLLLVICGCSLPSFNIEVFGLLGLAVESGNEFQEAKAYYSVFSLASMIVDQAHYLGTTANYIGLGLLSSILVITVFLVPLAQAAVLFLQWFFPMSAEKRNAVSVGNEVLSAWQYMEVYVLSIVITAWQLSGVSEFMINEYCGPLNDVFSTLAYFGILKEEDAQCFSVAATVEEASWLLVSASVLLAVLSHFVMSASSQHIQDNITPSSKRLHDDRWDAIDVQSTMSASVDDDLSEEQNQRKIHIRPVPPRFTDYYFFAVVKAYHADCGSDFSSTNNGSIRNEVDFGVLAGTPSEHANVIMEA